MSSNSDGGETAQERLDGEEKVASMRELREYANGRLDVPHSDVDRVAGLIKDREARRVYRFYKDNYDPSIFEGASVEVDDEEISVVEQFPTRFEDTEFAQKFVRAHATEAATRAIENGNLSQVAYLTGLPSYKPDVSGLHAIEQLADWLVNSEQCKLIYCAALMGRGKTDFSLLLFEVIHYHYRRAATLGDEEVPEPEFATNFKASTSDDVDAEIQEFHRYSDLEEWAEKGDSSQERWFIFDEASTELTAQSGANAQQVAEVFAPFVKKMRKCGVNMIVIGHDRQDVHPAIRAIASFIDKTGTKTAEIYEGIRSREPYGHLMSMSGIPQTSWVFDTDDVAEWEWDHDVEAGSDDSVEGHEDMISKEEWRDWRDRRIATLYEATDLTQPEVGDAFDVSQSTVSNAMRRFENGDLDVAGGVAPGSAEASAD